MDPLYGYESVNVEAQSRDPHSLLNWMRRMLAVRRQHRAFGRGSLRFLYPKNRKILAYLRELEDETILCVANVARSPQAVELDLSEFSGRVPIELNNGSLFPPIGQLTYLLTLPPYGFYWFILAKEGDWPAWHTPAPEPLPEYQTIVLRWDLVDTLLRSERHLLEREILPSYLAKRRWFAGKDETIEATRVAYLARLPGPGRNVLMGEIETRTRSGTSRWFLPLSILWEGEPVGALPSQLALAHVRRERQIGLLTDAFSLAPFPHEIVAALADSARFECADGEVRFESMPERAEILRLPADAEINWLSAEQSNSSLIIGDAVMLKIFRRISGGRHPEAEMGRYLTERGFANAPPFLGQIVRVAADGMPFSLGIAQGFVRNQGDAWSWLLDNMLRALDELSAPAAAADAQREHIEDYETLAASIGKRLGDMHAILARESADPAFAPEVASESGAEKWSRQARGKLEAAFELLAQQRQWNRPEDGMRARMLLERRDDLLAALHRLARAGAGSLMTRIHGDFHLGQVLVVSGDVYLIDFEGEPARTIEERRAKSSPLRDVAGLLRSFDYAAAAILDRRNVGTAPISDERRDEFIARFRACAPRAFLTAYSETMGQPVNQQLLDLFLIDKAAYELGYEAAYRPTWLPVPLAGLSALAKRALGEELVS
jgi:maltose alpha-D-glucosyltransferase/alpha-amylase